MDVITSIYPVVFLIVWTIYNKYSKFTGLLFSAFMAFYFLINVYVINYSFFSMIKQMFIIFTAICIFLGINYECTQNSINQILTWLVRLNVAILAFGDKRLWMKIVLILVAAMTPIFTITNGMLMTKNTVISMNIWVVIYTAVLCFLFSTNSYFRKNNSYGIIMICALIPCFMHFYSNQFLESRALILLLMMFLDSFMHSVSPYEVIRDNYIKFQTTTLNNKF